MQAYGRGLMFYMSFAVTLVFGYFIYHMGSMFLALLGLFLIAVSFPLTVFITNGVLQSTYFGELHNGIVFMVLGIAADDIFVFMDAWRQSKTLAPDIMNDKRKRLAYAFRRAAHVMAITSSTTSVAFVANYYSPLMPMKSVGIFAGVIIPMNYFLVIILMPPAVILYEERIEGRFCTCSCFKKQSKAKENEGGKIERFFGGKWNSFVMKYKLFIIFAVVVLTGFSVS